MQIQADLTILNRCVNVRIKMLSHNSRHENPVFFCTAMTPTSSAITPGRELRARPRSRLCNAAKILVMDAPPLEVSTLDISVTGLSLLTTQPLQRGQSCALAFDIRMDEGMKRINAWGTVVYCTPHDAGGFRVGVRFIDIDSISRMHIDQLCRQYVS